MSAARKRLLLILRALGLATLFSFIQGYTEKRNQHGYFDHNPVISEETALQLIKKKVRIIGIDSFSPDNNPWPIHKLLLKQDILIVENLINLKKLAGKRFQCYILPLNIKNGDGAPCRVIAVLP
ncbi:cyclase family protein [Candidatus Woesearchaeota archaeon]|nr:cyclase family protein [Candidatus Woesearchaeota archaeon]